MDLDEELKLIEEAKTNIQSFSQLYDKYFPKIYSYCLNRLANKEAAEDVTSQVFLQSIEVIKKFDCSRKTPLGPWLYTIAHNCMVNYLKKNSKFLSLLEEPRMTPGEAAQTDEVIKNVEKQIELTDAQRKIAIILNSINPRYAEVITLKYYAELETREIALSMDVKPTQVPVLLFRALDAFRKAYKEKYPGSEIFYIS